MLDVIKLGDEVKDLITGFKGIAVSRTEYLNGCVQYEVAPKVSKENKIPDAMSVDVESLVVLKRKKFDILSKGEPPGGRNKPPIKIRGY